MTRSKAGDAGLGELGHVGLDERGAWDAAGLAFGKLYRCRGEVDPGRVPAVLGQIRHVRAGAASQIQRAPRWQR